MSHNDTKAHAVMYFGIGGPPSSPPIALHLRTKRIKMAITASEQNSVTENARLKMKVFFFKSTDIENELLMYMITHFPEST